MKTTNIQNFIAAALVGAMFCTLVPVLGQPADKKPQADAQADPRPTGSLMKVDVAFARMSNEQARQTEAYTLAPTTF